MLLYHVKKEDFGDKESEEYLPILYGVHGRILRYHFLTGSDYR